MKRYPVLFFQAAIRKELNEFKSSEMEVHEESRIYTRSDPINNSQQPLVRLLIPTGIRTFVFWKGLLTLLPFSRFHRP